MSDRKYTVETVGDDIADFLDAVLDAADFDVEYEILDGEEAGNYFEKPTIVVKFSGPDLEYLMNNKGEALLAMEQLTQEVLDMAPDEHALMCFDANDYRLLRQEELRLSALTVAEKVRESNTPYRFSPMSSRERRLIHLAMRDQAGLRSESAGVGPNRHVVIYPAGMASLPDPPAPAGPPMRRSGGGDRDRDRGRGGDRGGRGGDRGRGRGGDRGGRGDRGRGGDRGRR
jgi:spoIIIJ-associated protein